MHMTGRYCQWGYNALFSHQSSKRKIGAIGKPNQNIAVLRGLALPTGCSVASTNAQVALSVLRDQSRSFVLANIFRVGRASPLKTAIF